MASAAGLVAQPGNSPYAASKFGIVRLTRTAAKEYATQNIRINAVCPTDIETPMIMEGRRKLAHNSDGCAQTRPLLLPGRPCQLMAALSREDFVRTNDDICRL